MAFTLLKDLQINTLYLQIRQQFIYFQCFYALGDGKTILLLNNLKIVLKKIIKSSTSKDLMNQFL